MDRNNISANYHIRICKVALRKESVDRNMLYDTSSLMNCVALRKESVDRNTNFNPVSLFDLVALRKESVDRNTQRRDFKRLGLRRSPQGERG